MGHFTEERVIKCVSMPKLGNSVLGSDHQIWTQRSLATLKSNSFRVEGFSEVMKI